MTSEDRGASSFDELASGLASGSISRGRALKLMGAALVGGTLASLGIGEAGADDLCKPEGKKCRKDKQCCSGICSRSGTSRSGTCACQENGVTCASASECCSGNCVNGQCSACPAGDCFFGTLNQNTCTCECAPFAVENCAASPNPSFQGCCPTPTVFQCVPVGTVCSPG
jgi:hypothetical protein